MKTLFHETFIIVFSDEWTIFSFRHTEIIYYILPKWHNKLSCRNSKYQLAELDAAAVAAAAARAHVLAASRRHDVSARTVDDDGILLRRGGVVLSVIVFRAYVRMPVA